MATRLTHKQKVAFWLAEFRRTAAMTATRSAAAIKLHHLGFVGDTVEAAKRQAKQNAGYLKRRWVRDVPTIYGTNRNDEYVGQRYEAFLDSHRPRLAESGVVG